MTSNYPDQWEADVVLADGATAHLRPVRPDDGPALERFFGSLSEETAYLRFLSVRHGVPAAELERLTRVDYDSRMVLIADVGGDVVAVASYDRLDTLTEAEVAFVVADAHQGRGLGTILLEYLAALGLQRGVRRFVADTLPTNHRMLGVFRDAGFGEEAVLDDGLVRVSLSIEPTAAAASAMDERDRAAVVRSMQRLLRPRSVAVIGASRQPGTIGHEVFANLLSNGFQGPVYPVNPSAAHVRSVPAYPNVLAIPGPVDLAVVAVPAPLVPSVVAECGAKGVGGLVVISAGFAETGPEGAALQRDVVRLAHAHGMRMVGPNCMGVINTSPLVSMDATFAPVPPPRGRLGFSSQSGALGITILEEAGRLGLGVSTFVSMGNKADVSGNDLLCYWEDDEDTDVVLLYLESFGNPRKFSRLARKVSRTKPIVAVKAGRSAAGSRAASSHTAALATPEAAVDALFRQTGVIRVDTLDEFFGVARVLAHQPLPEGRRVAIVGNAGGPGILAADACEGAGLEVPELSAATKETLRSFLPAAASVGNPVDLVASATPDAYEQAIRTVLADPAIDAVIVVYVPPIVTRPEEVAVAVAAAATSAHGKPIVANFLATEGVLEPLQVAGVPSFRFPEAAALALAQTVGYAEWRRRPEGTVPAFDDIDRAKARAVVDAALARHPTGSWLRATEATELLSAYGIPVVASIPVASAADAGDRAVALRFPVALKAAAADLVHKSDVGGVRLDLGSREAVEAAYVKMEADVGPAMEGAVLQPMVEAGVETIVGVVQDAAFGPLVLFGMGGTAVDLLGDRGFRVLPLTDLDVAEMVRSIRAAPLLFGYRGKPAADVDALQELLLRVGRLADEVPELLELDLNPVVVSSHGVAAVDAKVRIVPSVPHPELSVRRLR